MGVVLDLMRPKIDRTIKTLQSKLFETDPIAGPYFSKITNVTSSAYKRHGLILEEALLEAKRLCTDFEYWHEKKFQVAPVVDHIFDGSIDNPTKLIGTHYPYSNGDRTLQVDAIVF